MVYVSNHKFMSLPRWMLLLLLLLLMCLLRTCPYGWVLIIDFRPSVRPSVRLTVAYAGLPFLLLILRHMKFCYWAVWKKMSKMSDRKLPEKFSKLSKLRRFIRNCLKFGRTRKQTWPAVFKGVRTTATKQK